MSRASRQMLLVCTYTNPRLEQDLRLTLLAAPASARALAEGACVTTATAESRGYPSLHVPSVR